MTTNELTILKRLCDDGGIVTFGDTDTNVWSILELLKSRGFIELYIDGSATATSEGRMALLEYQEVAEKARQQKADAEAAEKQRNCERRSDQRHEWRVAVFGGAIGAIIGAVATVLIEHFIG